MTAFCNRQMEERHRARYGGEVMLGASSCLRASHPAGTLMCSPTQKHSEPCRLGVFMEVSLCRHDGLNHWPSVISSISTPLPSLWFRGLGWKFQSSNQASFFLVTSPKGLQAPATSSAYKRHSRYPEIPRGSELCARNLGKGQIFIFIISQREWLASDFSFL